ncbi:AMP-binding protein [Geomonas anaerohicana]|uniref:acetate--CoA ligase n=1 Tax=Geomonas anaerohicana TaxID=2798583 RepID=A0ABS0YGW3_9BACT|nr:AMP-binding protein [Geomonas anaerohicana]MBJ6751571.1 AMP-binding protein [Geomonas anaerohicana]
MIVDGQHNIGHICTRHQCDLGRSEKVAMRWISQHMEQTDYTFAQLDEQSNRFANVLAALGFHPGDIFFTFLPKMPEQFFAFLGTLKLQAVAGTLFSNFGEEALLDRLGDSKARGVITKKSFLKKIGRIRDQLPHLRYVIVADMDEHQSEDILSYRRLMEQASERFIAPITAHDIPSVLHYTSGSTGKPKGVQHVHGSILSQHLTAREVLQLSEDDIYWCTADQGWVTGTSYGIIGPWSIGVTQVHFGGGYNAEHWFNILEREKITVWYSAPTALRMLLKEEPELFARCDLSTLRHIFSVGEPLNPEVIHWARRTLDRDIYDTWFQTETGAIMIANRPGIEVRPGSMGKPSPGIEAAIIADDGQPVPDGEQGNLCVKPGWPSMFVTYLNNDEVYRQKFRGGYYYSGDTAYRDADGYFWFMGRSDDVINTAGHLVSPFEVESALLEIPEIAESGVIGAPDDLLFEKVVAYVALHDNCVYSPQLELKIRLHVSNKASTIATPQEIFVVDRIPKNKSGKIMRRVLKARYLGTDAGDLSTMEEE